MGKTSEGKGGRSRDHTGSNSATGEMGHSLVEQAHDQTPGCW